MPKKKPLILLTNDDGINSAGLWSAAETLAPLGQLWVVAPRDQATSSGRSNPHSSDGLIHKVTHLVKGVSLEGFAVGASPAQCIIFAIEEILPQKPDLVVSGINYGANAGADITRSGTIGAALEAANYGIPALAASVETDAADTFIHTHETDISTAAILTARFAQVMLQLPRLHDFHVLKIEVPEGATPSTPWEMTRLSPNSLYLPRLEKRSSWSEKATLDWEMQTDLSVFPEGTDSHAVFVNRHIAVTPLSLDLTSRINLKDLAYQIQKSLD